MTVFLDRLRGLFTMLLTAAVSIGCVLIFMPEVVQNPEELLNLLYLGCIVVNFIVFIIVVFLLCWSEQFRNTQIVSWLTVKVPGHRIIDELYSSIFSLREKKRAIAKAMAISFLGLFPFIMAMYCIGRAAEESVLRITHYFF